MLKKYFYYSLFLIASGIFLTPLNTFAGTLTNISVVGSSNVTSATTTYTVSFTTANAIPAGPFSAFYMTMNYSLGGNNFNFNGVGTGNVTLTVDGVSRSISAISVLDNVIHIYPSGSISAGANLVFTIQNVVNPNTAGSYGFFEFKTRTTGTDPIDAGSPSSVVIVAPDTTTQLPTLTSPTSNSRQNTLQLTYSLPEVPSAGTVTVAFNDGTTTTTLTMGNTQSVNTTVNLASLASTSGVTSTTASSLANGTYTVTLSYQDYLGNPASTAVASSVIIDTTVPLISAINSSILFPPGAAITWTTNEGSTSRVEYGLTDAYGSFTVLDSSFVTSHTVNITGLAQVTTYHYRVISTDAAGNSTTSADNTFTTQNGGGGGGGGINEANIFTEGKNVGEKLTQNETNNQNTSTTSTDSSDIIESTSNSNIPAKEETIVVSMETLKPKDNDVDKQLGAKPYLSSFIKYGAKNNPEDVKKLQIFLNDFEGESLSIDGVYKKEDFEAIKRFQRKYTKEILSYWNITEPTGYVYIKTIEMINRKVLEKNA